MDLEIIAVFVLLVLSLTSFALEKVSVDVTAIALLGIILGVAGLRVSSSWPSVSEVMMVFASEAPLTIACMFVISGSQPLQNNRKVSNILASIVYME